MNVIVIPLLSHLLWKSLGLEPSLVFLNNNSTLNFLLFNHDLINCSSISILASLNIIESKLIFLIFSVIELISSSFNINLISFLKY